MRGKSKPRVRLAHQFSLARLEVLLVRLRRRAGPVALMRGGGANAAAPGAPAQGQSWYQGQQGAVGGAYSRSVIWPFNDSRRGGRAGSTCVWPLSPSLRRRVVPVPLA